MATELTDAQYRELLRELRDLGDAPDFDLRKSEIPGATKSWITRKARENGLTGTPDKKPNRSNAWYREQYKRLEDYHDFSFNFRKRNAFKPWQKGQITRVFNQISDLVRSNQAEEYNNRFIETRSPGNLQLGQDIFGEDRTTNKGVFIGFPEVLQDTTPILAAGVTENGHLFRSRDDLQEVFFPVDPEEVAEDVEALEEIILELYPETEFFSFVFWGNTGFETHSIFDLSALLSDEYAAAFDEEHEWTGLVLYQYNTEAGGFSGRQMR